MRALIRADASAGMGIGHVVRCLALSEELIARGEQVSFAAARLPGRLRETLLAAGIKLEQVDVSSGSPDDAARSVELAEALNAHWVVLDGYHFGQGFHAALRTGPHRLLVVDDVGSTPVTADAILNQNAYADVSLYPGVGPDRLLLGTRYALLRRQFTGHRPPVRETPGRADHILITLGGGDTAEPTRRLLERLAPSLPSSAEVVVLTGPANEAGDSLAAAIRNAPVRVRVLHDVTDMAALMTWADLSVSGGGSTCLELAFMGVPNCILTMANNQRAVARAFDAAGAALALGEWEEREDQGALVAALAADRDRRSAMAHRARTMVDGKGAGRVADLMQAATLRLRPAAAKDEELLWVWRNDPEVRALSFQTEPIPREDHARWFRSVLSRADCTVWICSDGDGNPIGQGRMEIRRAEAEISVSLSSEWRGRGYGRSLIRMLTQRYLAGEGGVSRVTALIKVGNEGSRRAFESAGYVLEGCLDVAGAPAWQYMCRRGNGGVGQ